jgi:hypothetical protein
MRNCCHRAGIASILYHFRNRWRRIQRWRIALRRIQLLQLPRTLKRGSWRIVRGRRSRDRSVPLPSPRQAECRKPYRSRPTSPSRHVPPQPGWPASPRTGGVAGALGHRRPRIPRSAPHGPRPEARRQPLSCRERRNREFGPLPPQFVLRRLALRLTPRAIASSTLAIMHPHIPRPVADMARPRQPKPPRSLSPHSPRAVPRSREMAPRM